MPTAFHLTIWGWRVGITDRLFEWMAAIMILGFAATFAWPGDVIRQGVFLLLYTAGVSDLAVAAVLAAIGLLRATALAANGNWPEVGPRVRSAGAGMGCVIWVQLAVSMAAEAYHTGRASLGVAVYVALALGDAISTYRAQLDVGR